MKNRTLSTLIVALCTLGAMSVILVVFLINAYEVFPENIKVRENGVTESVFEVRDLRLCPAQSPEYDIDLVCDASGAYNITLSYEELLPGNMKHFVDVVVQANGETVYIGRLSKLIDDKEVVSFDGTLEADEPLTVTVRYVMPYETGNEAQGTSADFDLHLKIEKI